MKPRDHYQTIALTYSEILQEDHVWVPLGNFMNDWYEYHKDERQKLIADPIQVPEHPTQEQWQWAVFCAASVEYFCTKYHEPAPEWIKNAEYTLEDPWFYTAGTLSEELKQEFLAQAPEPFRKRNVFCSKRIYANKWENDLEERLQEAEDQAQAHWNRYSEAEKQALRFAAERSIRANPDYSSEVKDMLLTFLQTTPELALSLTN